MTVLVRFLYVMAVFTTCLLPSAYATTREGDRPPTSVRIQLKWYHQFQFAGLYAALEQGFFEQAGLEVELIEGGPTIDPVAVVEKGDAEFGIGNSELVIDFNKGRPVMAVAAIFQHSPYVILARRDEGLDSVRDLEGRTLMGETHAAELIAYLKLSGADLQRINIIPHSGSVETLQEVGAHGVAAMTAYTSTEPYLAAEHNIPYQIFNPRDIGIDFYGDTLFTSQRFASEHPDVVKALRQAVIEGWRYAHKHQNELVLHILERYKPRMGQLALVFEASTVDALLQAELVEIGYMSQSRWRHIAESFVMAGELNADYTLDGFIFDETAVLPPWVNRLVIGALFILVISLVVAFYIIRLNRKLNVSLTLIEQRSKELETANRKLGELSYTDGLTRLANRRRFDEALADECARARRSGQPLSLVLLDVDHFKKYNDLYGHQAGDACLTDVARIVGTAARRSSDLAARYGGEEFVIILPGFQDTQAFEFATKVCEQITALQRVHGGSELGYVTVSMGVAEFCPIQDEHPEHLVSRSDNALYCAKQRGRNRVERYQQQKSAKCTI